MIIVTGQPRTGTSLTMQTLHYLGLNLYGVKNSRGRDKMFNPNGYWESAETLAGDLTSLDHYDNDSAVKVNLRSLMHKSLLIEQDKIICVSRDFIASAKSQKKIDEAPGSADVERIARNDKKCYSLFKTWVNRPVLYVQFEELKKNPKREILRIKLFVNSDLDISRAIRNVI